MSAAVAKAQLPGGGGGGGGVAANQPALGTLAPGRDGQGRATLALPGRDTFYATRFDIRDLRTITFAPSGSSERPRRAVVVLWNERTDSGHDLPGRAISLDGGATVPIAGVTRYDIPLRFAGFTPNWSGVLRPSADLARLPEPGAVGAGEPSIPTALRAGVGGAGGAGTSVFIVQFVTQPIDEYRAALTSVGAEIHHWLAYHSYIVQLPSGAAGAPALTAIRAMPFVRWVGAMHPAYKLDPALITPGMIAGNPSNDPATAKRYNIMVNRRGLVDKAVVAEAIDVLGGQTNFGVDNYGFLMGATLTDLHALNVLSSDRVAFMDGSGVFGDDSDIARTITGADYVESVGGFTGEGVRGEVIDGNIVGTVVDGVLEDAHEAFDGRVPQIHGPVAFADNSLDRSHGTSTTGIVFGYKPNVFKGMAPEAEPIFATYWRYEDRPQHSQLDSASREQHIAELIDPEGGLRACFQSQSWSTLHASPSYPWTLAYTSLAAMVDDVLFRHDLTLFKSQSNRGADSQPRYAGMESWCKNLISVGGVKHRNTLSRADDEWNAQDLCYCEDLGWIEATPYCAVDPCGTCPSPCPQCNRNCPFGPMCVAPGGASIGPAADGRVKPDLVHLYDAVRAPGGGFYDSCTTLTTSSYMHNFGGTSAATPITAGGAAILFQMWHEEVFAGFGGGVDAFQTRPHSSTVKALLINSAHQYPFDQGIPDLDRFKQGWGMTNLQTLYDLRDDLVIINETQVLAEVQSYSIFVTPSGGGPLKATLVWRDPAGNPQASLARVNDLDLVVNAPGGAKYYGNDGLLESRWSLPDGGKNDSVNTVENVFIESPASGTWEIVVNAVELNEDGHLKTPEELDTVFALVVSGASLVSPLVAPDWNGDGTVDGADIAGFIDSYLRGRADVDRDRRTTAVDAAAFVTGFFDHLTKGGRR